MIVAVIRHAKVDHKWNPRMTSAEYDKGYADRYTTEELVQVYDVFVNDGRDIYNMFAEQSFPTFKDTYTLVNNSIVNNKDKYSSYEKFICTQEQYYVMALLLIFFFILL